MQHAVAVVRAFRPNFLILAPLCAAGGIAVQANETTPPNGRGVVVCGGTSAGCQAVT